MTWPFYQSLFGIIMNYILKYTKITKITYLQRKETTSAMVWPHLCTTMALTAQAKATLTASTAIQVCKVSMVPRSGSCWLMHLKRDGDTWLVGGFKVSTNLFSQNILQSNWINFPRVDFFWKEMKPPPKFKALLDITGKYDMFYIEDERSNFSIW